MKNTASTVTIQRSGVGPFEYLSDLSRDAAVAEAWAFMPDAVAVLIDGVSVPRETPKPDHELTQRQYVARELKAMRSEYGRLPIDQVRLTTELACDAHYRACYAAADSGVRLRDCVLDSLGPRRYHLLKETRSQDGYELPEARQANREHEERLRAINRRRIA